MTELMEEGDWTGCAIRYDRLREQSTSPVKWEKYIDGHNLLAHTIKKVWKPAIQLDRSFLVH